ncbi:threonylcarbamoyladenosine tRNA methylthiotransferase-like [Sinocyclocheilus grahami]|uniref:threonylcarbamoyladenosine tRNA methylthiotransferase-like n=1 Tax=Sinocyclocheilus grahami TaxID=75366 RepID=UPI0007ACCB15|nr:PREDICTED: threonylcarbamoyladenosine tRNA methylthiotransferase-like [Sinocyclocheilus grahami]
MMVIRPEDSSETEHMDQMDQSVIIHTCSETHWVCPRVNLELNSHRSEIHGLKLTGESSALYLLKGCDIGERQRVLVTEDSFDSQYYVAHNKFYEQVLVPKKPEFKGKMIEVDIYEAGKHYMKGRPVEDARVFTPSIAQPLQKGQVSGLPQELKATHQNGACASVASSALVGQSWRFDGDGLKLLSLGLALAAVIVALVIEKLH